MPTWLLRDWSPASSHLQVTMRFRNPAINHSFIHSFILWGGLRLFHCLTPYSQWHKHEGKCTTRLGHKDPEHVYTEWHIHEASPLSEIHTTRGTARKHFKATHADPLHLKKTKEVHLIRMASGWGTSNQGGSWCDSPWHQKENIEASGRALLKLGGESPPSKKSGWGAGPG